MQVLDRERNLEEFGLSLVIGGTVTGIVSAFVGADSVLDALVFAFTMLILTTFAVWEVVDFVGCVHSRYKRRFNSGVRFRHGSGGFERRTDIA